MYISATLIIDGNEIDANIVNINVNGSDAYITYIDAADNNLKVFRTNRKSEAIATDASIET